MEIANPFYEIENTLYEIADRHIMIAGTEDTLDNLALDEMENYLLSTGIKYLIQCAEWRDGTGYTMTIAFIDKQYGDLHMLGWDCLNRNIEEGNK